ncbi:amphi-Trp domain-containing protein [Halopiger djelfimassiliensis]|uniref:amphi-Trp domain-containing protein n=1 Tax=Halopiger djelfimassiliensis TaxID=1293047 RepID=UPI000677D5DC|nr:amphi-Trp domain-containing protein [Halopiger djelfimassiliensis]
MAKPPNDPDDPDDRTESDAQPSATTEFELERTYRREDLSAVFREFAAAFEDGRPIRMRGDDRSVRIVLPDRVVAEFEVETAVADDPEDAPPAAELELELEWNDADGSSVQITERGADTDAGASGESAEVVEPSADPATAAMPLEGVPGPSGSAAGDAAATGSEPSKPERTSRFEIYRDRADEWRWRLVHWNGNIIADSGEGYASRHNAKRAARSVMRSAPTASIEQRDETPD